MRAAPFSPSAYAFPPPSVAANFTRLLISHTNELRTRETTVPSTADAAVRNGWAGLSRGWEEAALCSFNLPLFSSISIIFPSGTFTLPCSPSVSIIFSSLLFSFPLCHPSYSHTTFYLPFSLDFPPSPFFPSCASISLFLAHFPCSLLFFSHFFSIATSPSLFPQSP